MPQVKTVVERSKLRNVDFENFQPKSWQDIVGNQEIVEHFQNMLYKIRVDGAIKGWNTLLTGPSRSGKTSEVKLFLRSLICLNIADYSKIYPCFTCPHCKSNYETYGNRDWENEIGMLGEENFKTPIRCLIRVVNCAEVTADELDEIVQEVRVHDERLKIIYLDEVHRLRHRRLDERLLKPMEDSQAIWIGSSANIEKNSMDDTSKLDPMFQNRFSFRLKTQLPTIKELVAWLAKRCSEAELQVDEPVREILTIVAKRSQCVPGLALQVLNRAVKSRNRLLTKKIAEEFVFSFDE